MATLKEFEDALRQNGMHNALAILDGLKKRDREKRSIAPARRVVGRKMTADLARTILEMHSTTGMTQQEIAFKLGVNQGRVNEVIKRGKWLNADPQAPEAQSRDKAIERLTQRARARRTEASVPRTMVPSPQAVRKTPNRRGAIAASHEAMRPSPASKAPRTGEFAFDPRPLAPTKHEGTRRLPLPRSEQDPAPIVSAQLAFLDL